MKETRINRIEEIKHELFLMEFIDRWTAKDKARYNELVFELAELNEK